MKTFFDPKVQAELEARLQALKPSDPARWGTMDAARMLAHCVEGMKMATGDLKVKTSPMVLIGWLLKRIAYDDSRFRHGAPTARELTIADPRDFEAERARLLAMFGVCAAGPQVVRNLRHPFFGTLTPDQWGGLLYKHLDHHFRQFGV